MNMIKNILAVIGVTIFINVLGYFYLFGDLYELPDIKIKKIPISANSLYEHQYHSIFSSEIRCMAENIFHEARNQSVHGMQAVAFVTINRVKHINFPSTVCEVVYEPYQFSWTIDDRLTINLNNEIEYNAWKQAKALSYLIMNKNIHNDMHGVTHYHATYVNPHWNMTAITQIDDHIFYVGAW